VSARLVVFGGAGDLMRRLLLPALAELQLHELLPDGLAVVAVGRSEKSSEVFRDEMAVALREHAPRVPEPARTATITKLSYARADATDAAQLRPLVTGCDPLLAYLALPPAVMEDCVRALARAGLPRGSRVAVEKPLGEDLASARSLNAALSKNFPSEDAYRIDHFLGLRALRDLVRRRARDDAFDAMLHRRHATRVEVVWDETLALEGRADFYDNTGALRDMVQNHLLQVLAHVAMERPTSDDPCELRRLRTELFAAVRRPEQPGRSVIRARYTAGTIDGRRVPAYVDEDGVDPGRKTETFIELTLHIDTDRWRGVPFKLRTGKALAAGRTEICVYLHDGAQRLAIDDAPPGGPTLSAYGEVLRSLLAGEPTTSVGAAEAEACWEIVDPIIKSFDADEVPLREYPAGSDGPGDAS
jgi:glucose-6-phosphate 1-dehydrogenase